MMASEIPIVIKTKTSSRASPTSNPVDLPFMLGSGARIHLRSIESRLGHYLLVNSDGVAWLPDAQGRTVNLGVIFGREPEVLRLWADAVQRIGAAP